MYLNKIFKNNNGIGLIEVIASIGLATVVVTSLVSLSIFTLRTSLKSKLLVEGSNFARRELELVRAYRDSKSWSTFVTVMNACTSSTKTPLCNITIDSTTGVLSVNTNGPNPKVEAMSVEDVSIGFYVLPQPDQNVIKVNVVSQWKEGDQIKNTTLRGDFTNWQQK